MGVFKGRSPLSSSKSVGRRRRNAGPMCKTPLHMSHTSVGRPCSAHDPRWTRACRLG